MNQITNSVKVMVEPLEVVMILDILWIHPLWDMVMDVLKDMVIWYLKGLELVSRLEMVWNCWEREGSRTCGSSKRSPHIHAVANELV